MMIFGNVILQKNVTRFGVPILQKWSGVKSFMRDNFFRPVDELPQSRRAALTEINGDLLPNELGPSFWEVEFKLWWF